MRLCYVRSERKSAEACQAFLPFSDTDPGVDVDSVRPIEQYPRSHDPSWLLFALCSEGCNYLVGELLFGFSFGVLQQLPTTCLILHDFFDFVHQFTDRGVVAPPCTLRSCFQFKVFRWDLFGYSIATFFSSYTVRADEGAALQLQSLLLGRTVRLRALGLRPRRVKVLRIGSLLASLFDR